MITKSKQLLIVAVLALFCCNTVTSQEQNKEQDQSNKLRFYDYRGTNAIDAGLGASKINGDFDNTDFGFYFRIGYKRSLTPNLFLGLTANSYSLQFDEIEQDLLSFDFNIEYLILPYDRFSPYLYGGFGVNTSSDADTNAVKTQFGVGVEYIVTDGLGLKLYYEYNYSYDKEMDFLIGDMENDAFMRIGIGVNYYFGGTEQKDKLDKEIKTIINSNPIVPDN